LGHAEHAYNAATDVNSMYNIEQMDGAHAYWTPASRARESALR